MPDPRARSGQQYPIGAVLALVALGVLRGAVHLNTILRTAQKLNQNQRARLRLRFKKGTRFRAIPGYDMFREILRRLDLETLAGVLTQWLQAHAGRLPRTLAVDGKTIRDHLGLIVTLVDTDEGTPVAVAAAVRGKGHELKTTQTLLASSQVHLLHPHHPEPAFAKLLQQLVAANAVAGLFHGRVRGRENDGGLKERAGLLVRGEQRIRLPAQFGIAPTSRIQERRPLPRRQLARSAEDLFQTVFLVGGHISKY